MRERPIHPWVQKFFAILRSSVLYAGQAGLFSERLALASFDCHFMQNKSN
jgi:hypothetical protein